jgi:protocatechuate 3,4-dioxygenase beta subunit
MRAGAVLITALAWIASAGAQPAQPSATGLIVGQVVDAATGKPVGGALVAMEGEFRLRTTAGVRVRGLPRVLTGADGRFFFRDVPRGSFSLVATKGGYAEGRFGRRRPGGEGTRLVLADGERVGDAIVRMWKLAAITGMVADEAGEALVGVQVHAFRRTVTRGRQRFVNAGVAFTDDRGIYRLGGLVPGEYVVGTAARLVSVPLSIVQEARAGSWSLMSAVSDIGATPNVPGGPLAMQVGDVVYGLGRGAPIPVAGAGDRLFVYPATFHPAVPTLAQSVAVTLDSGDERTGIDVLLNPVPTARVSGMLVAAEGPAAGMVVRLLPTHDDEQAAAQAAPATMTDRSGRFTFPTVPAGEYSLRAATNVPARYQQGQPADLVQWAEMPLTVGPADIDGLAIALQDGLRISGRLEFDGTTPKPTGNRLQASIVVEAAGGPPAVRIPSPAARVDASGQFTSVGLSAGRYVVRVDGSPVGWMFKSATYNGQDVSETPFELRGGDATGVVLAFTDRWTGLRGVVRSARGDADADAAVLLFTTDRSVWTDAGPSPRRMKSARTGRAGEYSFRSIPPGDYYVVALPDERTADWRDAKFLDTLVGLATHLTIGDGEHKTLDLRTRDVRP